MVAIVTSTSEPYNDKYLRGSDEACHVYAGYRNFDEAYMIAFDCLSAILGIALYVWHVWDVVG